MAGIKHTWNKTVKNDTGASVLAESTIFTASAEENFKEVAAAGTTLEIDLAVDVSQIVSFFVASTQAVTLHTNTTPTGAQDFSLAANVALDWNNADVVNANPLTTNITKFYFVNAGAVDATVVGGFLLDL